MDRIATQSISTCVMDLKAIRDRAHRLLVVKTVCDNYLLLYGHHAIPMSILSPQVVPTTRLPVNLVTNRVFPIVMARNKSDMFPDNRASTAITCFRESSELAATTLTQARRVRGRIRHLGAPSGAVPAKTGFVAPRAAERLFAFCTGTRSMITMHLGRLLYRLDRVPRLGRLPPRRGISLPELYPMGRLRESVKKKVVEGDAP